MPDKDISLINTSNRYVVSITLGNTRLDIQDYASEEFIRKILKAVSDVQ